MATPIDNNHSIRILAGHASMRTFARMVKTYANDSLQFDDVALAQEWKSANAVFQQLAAEEPDAALVTELTTLPREALEIADAALSDPRVRRTHELLPTKWAMVDLRRLIAWQNYVDLDHITHLRTTLPEAPTVEALVRFVVHGLYEQPPLAISAVGGNKFIATSPSSDIRITDTVSLPPEAIQGHIPHGVVGAVLAVLVGFSTNIMTAISMNQRLLLVNGTHHACTLYAHGITHAPCLVQQLASEDDLDLVAAPNATNRTFEWYFTTRRPPLLKDFFNPQLTKKIRSRPDIHVLEIELNFRQSTIYTP